MPIAGRSDRAAIPERFVLDRHLLPGRPAPPPLDHSEYLDPSYGCP